MGRRSWRAAAAAVAASALAALPSASGAPAASAYDFGDAPDGVSARYSAKPSVRGRFPSRAASDGPRLGADGPRIGARWTAEGDSRQVNRDAEEAVSLSARSCTTSTVTFLLDGSRVADGERVYVNAWFDWNQDGDWADGTSRGCGPEWGIQNVRIDPATLGAQKAGVVTLRFRAGAVPRQFWWRLQVHTGPPMPHTGGRLGLAGIGGEVDDYRYESLGWELVGGGKKVEREPDAPPGDQGEPVLLLFPHENSIAHGGASDCDYSLVGGAFELGSWRVTRVRHLVKGEPDAEGIVVERVQQASKIWTILVRSTTLHRRSQPFQTIDVALEVTAIVEGRRRVFGPVWCSVYVAHGNHAKPPFVSAPAKSAPVVRGRADLAVSAKLDTAFLDRNGKGRVTGTVILTSHGPAKSMPAILLITSDRVEVGRWAEVEFRSCVPHSYEAICTGFDLARGIEQAFAWSASVTGGGPLTMKFWVQSYSPSETPDPRLANNEATVTTVLRAEP